MNVLDKIKEIFDDTTRKLIIIGSGLTCTIIVVINLYFGWLGEDNVIERYAEIITFSVFAILQVKMMYAIHKGVF